MLCEKYLRNVPLPDDLTNDNIYQAMRKTQDIFALIHENTGLNLTDFIQANSFSGMVSNIYTKTLGEISVYRPYHDQRYPDLMHENKKIGLEIKTSNKPMKGGEGHNGHSGWHLVVCFTPLENGEIEFSQAEIAYLTGYGLENADWKYMGSKRNQNNSQRTETYVTTNIGTAKLRDGTVYFNPELIQISRILLKKRTLLSQTLPIPPFSPFYLS